MFGYNQDFTLLSNPTIICRHKSTNYTILNCILNALNNSIQILKHRLNPQDRSIKCKVSFSSWKEHLILYLHLLCPLPFSDLVRTKIQLRFHGCLSLQRSPRYQNLLDIRLLPVEEEIKWVLVLELLLQKGEHSNPRYSTSSVFIGTMCGKGRSRD